MKKLVWRKIGVFVAAICSVILLKQEVFAASEDIIDMTQKGSLTVYKYDLTAAEEDGIDTSGEKFANNGKEDEKAKEEFKNYVISGVEFTNKMKYRFYMIFQKNWKRFWEWIIKEEIINIPLQS